MKQLIFLLSAVFIFSACQKQTSSLNSDDEKTIYAIGNDMGMRLKTLQLSNKEKEILKMGVDDGVSGKKPQVEPREFLSKVGEMIRTRQKAFGKKEQEEGKKVLEAAEKKEKAEKTESGLIYVSTKEGTGKNPTSSDRVKVNYHGTLRDGEVFDTTQGKQPVAFRLDRVISCWKEGVQKMKVGGKAELYCPSKIAYGDRGAPPKIPPGAVLKFEVELIEIVKEEEEDLQKKESADKSKAKEGSKKNNKNASEKNKEKPSKVKVIKEKATDPHDHKSKNKEKDKEKDKKPEAEKKEDKKSDSK